MDEAARRFVRDLIKRERLRPHVEAALVRLDDRLRERLRSPFPPPSPVTDGTDTLPS